MVTSYIGYRIQHDFKTYSTVWEWSIMRLRRYVQEPIEAQIGSEDPATIKLSTMVLCVVVYCEQIIWPGNDCEVEETHGPTLLETNMVFILSMHDNLHAHHYTCFLLNWSIFKSLAQQNKAHNFFNKTNQQPNWLLYVQKNKLKNTLVEICSILCHDSIKYM